MSHLRHGQCLLLILRAIQAFIANLFRKLRRPRLSSHDLTHRLKAGVMVMALDLDTTILHEPSLLICRERHTEALMDTLDLPRLPSLPEDLSFRPPMDKDTNARPMT
jgi:hypothetical protein